MFIETVRTPSLAHLSYVVGSEGVAAVVDPRLDIDTYLDLARERGCHITHIFETHRNEDLVSGAAALAAETGATVLHGPHAAGEVNYAETVTEGRVFELGALSLSVLETPGHTDDSISLVLKDEDAGDRPVAVFTGDCLFAGDVGRTDFYPDRAREVAGLLYDSLHDKLIPLGDDTIVHPAHGAGSVCGANMADRDFSTIGIERASNAMLQRVDREDFIAAKLEERHPRPQYFSHMEALNLTGVTQTFRSPPLISPERLAALDEALVVDVRSPESFCGAHVPGAHALPLALLGRYAGYFIPYDRDLALLADSIEQAERARAVLQYLGYERVVGAMVDGLVAWAAGGRPFAKMRAVDTDEVASRIENEGQLLDVRRPEEVTRSPMASATNIPLADLTRDHEKLDRRQPVTVMCASGARATIAASLLRMRGFDDVDVYLGSMGAWLARQA